MVICSLKLNNITYETTSLNLPKHWYKGNVRQVKNRITRMCVCPSRSWCHHDVTVRSLFFFCNLFFIVFIIHSAHHPLQTKRFFDVYQTKYYNIKQVKQSERTACRQWSRYDEWPSWDQVQAPGHGYRTHPDHDLLCSKTVVLKTFNLKYLHNSERICMVHLLTLIITDQ